MASAGDAFLQAAVLRSREFAVPVSADRNDAERAGVHAGPDAKLVSREGAERAAGAGGVWRYHLGRGSQRCREASEAAKRQWGGDEARASFGTGVFACLVSQRRGDARRDAEDRAAAGGGH